MNIAEYNQLLRGYRPAAKNEQDINKITAARCVWETIKVGSKLSPAHSFAHLQWQDQRQQAAREAQPTPKQ